jgi:hypothetical protein
VIFIGRFSHSHRTLWHRYLTTERGMTVTLEDIQATRTSCDSASTKKAAHPWNALWRFYIEVLRVWKELPEATIAEFMVRACVRAC